MSPRFTFVWVSCVLAFATASAATAGAAAAPANETGIILDRLSPEELRQWRAIERLVTTAAPNGTPRYPTLRGLWEWAAESGHAIRIELSSPECAAKTMAGKFVIERVDPQGARHVGLIRLCLANIDRPRVHGGVTRTDGLVRFAGLKQTERCAEVLGHELAHAVYAFGNPERARMIMERVDSVNAEFVSHRAERGNEPLDPALRQRLGERDDFLDELEAHAEAMELLVWRELAKRR